MNMKKQSLIVTMLIFVLASALVTCGDGFVGTLHDVPLFSETLWGEWIRMDTGETWYFASNYRMVGSAYFSTPVNMVRQSENVIKVTEGTGVSTRQYFLYASRIRNSTFEASAVRDDGARSLFSRAVNVPKGTTAVIEAVKNGVDKQTVEIGDNGELEVENIIAGDDYQVTIDNYEFTVTPNTDGENVGTFTLTRGVNIKTSIVPKSPSTDLMRLYSGQNYNLTIKFTNIGETISKAMEYRFSLPPELTIISNANSPLRLTEGDLQAFMPGQTRDVDITIQCGSIVNEFEFKDIAIETEDTDRKKWTDSVSLKINRESVTFNIWSERAINGVVIVPNGKAYHFQTSVDGGLFSTAVIVPKKYQKDYLIAFSGAQADTEAKYSFAIDRVPATDFNAHGTLSLLWQNGTEGQAAAVNYDQEVMGYLEMNEVNYYKVRFTE